MISIFNSAVMDFLLNYKIPYSIFFVLWHIIYFVIVAILLLITVIILVLFERKYLAFFTRRKGPNRVGFCGCMQTVADAIKLLFKENITPSNADKLIYFIAPLMVFVPIMIVWFLIPYTSLFTPLQSSCSLILFMALLSIPIIGILFAGYSSGNRYSLIGGLRSCVQAISSEIPVFIVLASIIILSNSMDLNVIVKSQETIWNIFPNFFGFIIFFICALIIMNRIPFDFPEAESELVAGYNCEYSGMKFAIFFLGEYALTFIFSAFITTIFLGGYNAPFNFYIANLFDLEFMLHTIILNLEQFFWMMLKTSLIILIIMWIRATYPRFKTDKTLEFCWYILIPISLFNLLIICLIKGIL